MAVFKPCLGKTVCADGDGFCRACGRSFEEIEQTRQLVESMTQLTLQLDYDNAEEFAAYLAKRLVKKVRHAREQELS